MAEFTGVAILVIFGAGVDCQVVLSSNTGVASSQKGVSTVFISPLKNLPTHYGFPCPGLSLYQFWMGCRCVFIPRVNRIVAYIYPS